MASIDRRVSLFGIALLVIAADQGSKVLAVARLRPGVPVRALGSIMYWTLQRNPGAAFSLFTRFPWLFTILAFGIAIGIIARSNRTRDGLHAAALGLVLGGAVGNLVDRIVREPAIFRGHVVDFIDFRVWPVFNVADACIVSGALLLVLATSRAERRARAS